MLTLQNYWMGRDVAYADELTFDIERNAAVTVGRINVLAAMFKSETGITLDTWASGWRPPTVNGGIANAAKGSKHLTARAGDVRDTPERDFARWCLRNLDKLESIGLWMEDPQWTWREQAGGAPWVHLQTVPPGSGRRVFIPSTSPPLASLLPEQGGDAAGALA